MNMHMPSKNVAVQKNVYDALAREKRRGESFTELFGRLLSQRGTLEEVRGAWGSAGAAEDARRLLTARGLPRGRRE
jgi:predicted CopG family antitoxin